MRKLFTCALPLFLLQLSSFSQTSWNIPLSLYNKAVLMNPASPLGILVEGNPIQIADDAKKHGGFLRYSQGTICSIQIPAGELVAFSREPGIERIGNAPIKMQTLNDTMKVLCRVNQVRAGMAPLTQGYSGDSVIMGIIDSGVDFTHPDFSDANGNTRILKIWDQRDNTGPGPAPWMYGTLWDSSQINNGTCTHNDLAYFGHGTEICGIAAGNGRSTNARDYSGVAPKSNYIVVALDFNGANSPTAVADAAAYIYAQAQALGRPCVINASVGDYSGSHDGQDLQAMMIDSLLDIPSRSFVCAAGNGGNIKMHLSYQLSSDTNITFFTYPGYNIYVQLWADTNNFNGAKMSIGCTQDGIFADRGRIPFEDIQSNLGIYSTDTLKNSANQRMAIVNKLGSIQGSAYSMEYLIIPDSTTYDFSLMTTGSGLFHLWSFDMYANALPSSSLYPKIIYYKDGDTTHTICSSFQCSNRTITVANYVNRAKWENVNNQWVTDTTVVAEDMMWNSSSGPTRDGRQKPDIAAPGANDLTTQIISQFPFYIANAPDAVGVGGFHLLSGGTSAASPVVAGCADLWMQLFPTANWQDVKNAVEYCARTDNFTGTNLPDYEWGYGKIDAFGMMTNCALTTNNPVLPNENALQLFPNPVNSGQSFELHYNTTDQFSQIEIYSVNGELIFSQAVSKDQTSITIPGNLLSSGVYVVKLRNENSFRTEKLVVE